MRSEHSYTRGILVLLGLAALYVLARFGNVIPWSAR